MQTESLEITGYWRERASKLYVLCNYVPSMYGKQPMKAINQSHRRIEPTPRIIMYIT